MNFDFATTDPIPVFPYTDFWNCTTVMIKGNLLSYHTLTNFVLAFGQYKTVFYGMIVDGHLVREINVDLEIKIWAYNCGFDVLSLNLATVSKACSKKRKITHYSCLLNSFEATLKSDELIDEIEQRIQGKEIAISDRFANLRNFDK
jgi:hypothetical protein